MRSLAVGTVAAALTVAGVLVGTLVPAALRSKAQAVAATYLNVDSPSAPGFAAWQDSDVGPLVTRLSVYVFNVTNPDAVLRGVAPRVAAVGPLILLQHVVRHNITWQDGGDVVQFKEWVYYTLDPNSVGDGGGGGGHVCSGNGGDDGSGDDDDVSTDDDGDGVNTSGTGPSGPCANVSRPAGGGAGVTLDTVVVTVNIPFITAAVNGYAWLAVQNGDDHLFTTRTIGQMLFGRQADPVLTALATQFPRGTITTAWPGLLVNVTSQAANDAAQGWNRMYTGASTTYRAREYVTWNGMGSLYCCLLGPCGTPGPTGLAARPAWGTATANGVRGTAGHSFRSGVTAADTLRVFAPALTRSLDVVTPAGAPMVMHQGVPALRFQLSNASLAPAAQNPDNAGYYSYGYPALLNTTNCRGMMPTFMSKPFFLGTNASVGQAVGLPAANPTAHDTYWDVEPLTGLVMSKHHRWQLNLYLSPYLQPTGTLQLDAASAGVQTGGGGGDDDGAQVAGGGTGGAPAPQPWQGGLPNSQPITAPLFPLVDSVYLPLLWVDEHSQVTPAAAQALTEAVLAPVNTANTIFIAGMVVAAVSGVVALAVYTRSRWTRGGVRSEAWERGMTALMGDQIVTAQTRRALFRTVTGATLTGTPPDVREVGVGAYGLPPVAPASHDGSGGDALGQEQGLEMQVPLRRAPSHHTLRMGGVLGDGGNDYGSVGSGRSSAPSPTGGRTARDDDTGSMASSRSQGSEGGGEDAMGGGVVGGFVAWVSGWMGGVPLAAAAAGVDTDAAVGEGQPSTTAVAVASTPRPSHRARRVSVGEGGGGMVTVPLLPSRRAGSDHARDRALKRPGL